jgi:hypothetical protein
MMGARVFWGCIRLKYIHIPSSVESIGAGAFHCCGQLTWVHLQGNLHTVKEGTFRFCDSLTLMNLVIPSEQHFAQLVDDDDEFMKGLKLGSAASNFDDLVGKLQHRFDALPVHRLCY